MPTRRTQLAAFGLGLAAAPLAGASAARAAAPWRIVARRQQITLPAAPTPGVTYIATFELTDESGKPMGEAAAGTSVVDVTTEGPVILSQVVLRLTDGELHYQRIMNRFGGYPRRATGAVVGGTGAYAGASGQVQITWPDADTIQIAVERT